MSLDSIIAKQRAHAPVLAQKPLQYRLQKLAELRADEYPKMLEELIEKPRYTTRNELEIRYIEQP